MTYYYMTKDGEFTESSAPIRDEKHIQLSELEYAISRFAVRKYTKAEIIRATNRIFAILEEEE